MPMTGHRPLHLPTDDSPSLELEHEALDQPLDRDDPRNRPVVIIGLGADARAAAEIVALYDRVVYGFISTEQPSEALELNHVPVLGRLSEGPYRQLLEREQLDYVIAEPLATDRIRLMTELFQLTGRHPLTVVHPAAVVSASADLAAGVLVHAGCVIGANVRIERLTTLGPGCIVEADAELGAAVTLQLGVRLGQKVVVEDEAFVGAGANVVSGVRLERGAQVGPGSLVLKSVKAGTAVFGAPAAPVANPSEVR